MDDYFFRLLPLGDFELSEIIRDVRNQGMAEAALQLILERAYQDSLAEVAARFEDEIEMVERRPQDDWG